MIGLIGRKLGMTRVFDAKGNVVPVTVIELGPNQITNLRTPTTQRLCGRCVSASSRSATSW